MKGVGLAAVSRGVRLSSDFGKLEIYDLDQEEIRDKEAIENFMARFAKLW